MSRTRNMVLCAMFTVLVAIGAFIRVPVPFVPFTLQVLFTTLAGLILGPKLGAMSVTLYVALGLLGLPIFASGGGIGYVFQPTFGYFPRIPSIASLPNTMQLPIHNFLL